MEKEFHLVLCRERKPKNERTRKKEKGNPATHLMYFILNKFEKVISGEYFK